MNKMIQTAFLRDAFKEASKISIHKGGNKHDLTKQRPNTVSSVVRNVISKTLNFLVRNFMV